MSSRSSQPSESISLSVPRRALARVNLAAVERNVAGLCERLAAGTAMCAVVKADGYGHGSAPVARAALAGGATVLAVATADEAAILRDGGIDAPLLVMGALWVDELDTALGAGADVVAWSDELIERLKRAPTVRPVRVHIKLDTGMGRLGTRERAHALELAESVLAAPGLQLAGAMTHFATADDDPEFMASQLAEFSAFVAALRRRAPGVTAHAANSAAVIRDSATHFDMVRCGIAIYGCDPMQSDPAAHGLEPALELCSYVAAVKRAGPGQSVGYGRRFTASEETWTATIPIGYGDGVRRALTNNCDVLIGGRYYPLVGTVSMDNVTAEVGSEAAVHPGQQVTIIGRDGAERQTAEDLAERIGTINYEVVCGISARVPRCYHCDDVSCER